MWYNDAPPLPTQLLPEDPQRDRRWAPRESIRDLADSPRASNQERKRLWPRQIMSRISRV